MLDWITSRIEQKKKVIPEIPCAIGRQYHQDELRKICEYMSEDVYFEIDFGSRENKVLIENAPSSFSFSQNWREKAMKIISSHMLDMGLPIRRLATIRIRFVPNLWSEELKKSKPAEALILGDPKAKKREILIRIAVDNDKTYAIGHPLGEVDVLYSILHELSEVDSYLLTKNPNDSLFDDESFRKSKKLIASPTIDDAVAYNLLEDEQIANAKAEKTLHRFYSDEEVRGARPISPFAQHLLKNRHAN